MTFFFVSLQSFVFKFYCQMEILKCIHVQKLFKFGSVQCSYYDCFLSKNMYCCSFTQLVAMLLFLFMIFAVFILMKSRMMNSWSMNFVFVPCSVVVVLRRDERRLSRGYWDPHLYHGSTLWFLLERHRIVA